MLTDLIQAGLPLPNHIGAVTVTISFLDLRRLHGSIRAELEAAVAAVIDSGGFVGSKAIRGFEEDFAAVHDAVGAAGCGSGTDALALALRAAAVGPGDEVVVPAMTFVATAEAVVHVGATPVLADVDPETLLLTEQTVAAVQTDRTRAVIPVHLYGHVVPFSAIDAWKASGLVVIEDAAQAHLASFEGEPIGSHSDAACFSFYPGKNLGAFGDGGAVISRESALLDEVRLLRDHGRTTKYQHESIGWCSRLDGLQAAVLRVKLRHLEEWTQGRRAAAALYRDLLGANLVPWVDGAVHHLLVVRAADRADLGSCLDAAGVKWGIHYPIALTDQPSLAPYVTKPAPAAQQAANEVLSLPMDPLLTDHEIRTVAETVLAAQQP